MPPRRTPSLALVVALTLADLHFFLAADWDRVLCDVPILRSITHGCVNPEVRSCRTMTAEDEDSGIGRSAKTHIGWRLAYHGT